MGPQGHGMPQSWQQNQMGMSGGNFRPGMMQQRFGPGGMGGIPPNMQRMAGMQGMSMGANQFSPNFHMGPQGAAGFPNSPHNSGPFPPQPNPNSNPNQVNSNPNHSNPSNAESEVGEILA